MINIKFSTNINAQTMVLKAKKDMNIAELENLSKQSAYVGWPETAINTNDEGQRVSVAMYAKANNHGYTMKTKKGKPIVVPARPFFTKGFFFDKYAEQRQKLYALVLNELKNKKITAKEAWAKIGLKAVNQVQDSILTGPWAPNSPYTVAKKKSSKPLIDTSTMINTVTYIVRDND